MSRNACAFQGQGDVRVVVPGRPEELIHILLQSSDWNYVRVEDLLISNVNSELVSKATFSDAAAFQRGMSSRSLATSNDFDHDRLIERLEFLAHDYLRVI